MLISVDCELALSFPEPTSVVLMLCLHPSLDHLVRQGEQLEVEPTLEISKYLDVYGNRCGRVFVPAGRAIFRNQAVIEIDGKPDPQEWDAYHHRVQELPDDTLLFLLPSRYCEVDSGLKDFAWEKFGRMPAGWPLVRAICDYAHNHIRFDYLLARANRTAHDVFHERVGVCRDYAHLAITLCRCLNIPARYCTGYLGDIGVPPDPAPMDFSAWFEVYMGGRWYAFDARHNIPRIGRVLMAIGRDAADVALTTAFGFNQLESFRVGTKEIEKIV